jgi:hypothetical protein
MMRARCVVVVLVPGLLSCAAQYQEKLIRQKAAAQTLEVEQYTVTTTVSASCNDGEKVQRPGDVTFDPPGKREVVFDGDFAEQPCGLIAIEVGSEKFRQRFVRRLCADGVTEKCGKQYTDMFLARLTQRYTFADWQQLYLQCRAYPIECGEFITLEQWIVASHNTGLRAWGQRQKSLIRRRAASDIRAAYLEQQRQFQRGMAAFAAAAEGMANTYRKKCTSKVSGSTVTTYCDR